MPDRSTHIILGTRAAKRLHRDACRYFAASLVLLAVCTFLAGISIGTWAYLFFVVDR